MAGRAWASRGVTLTDQAVSSLSNVLAVILVARALSADAFGVFSLSYAVVVLALGLTRAYFGTRISLAPSAVQARTLASRVAGGMIVAGAPLALVVFGVSLVLASGADPVLLLVVSVAAPVVCLQDVLRFAAVATGRPVAALSSDGLWLIIIAAPLVLGVDLTAKQAVLLWLIAASTALLVALLTAGIRPAVREGVRELRTRDHMGESMTYVTLVGQGTTLAVLAIVANSIGPAGAGALRGASTIMGPVSVAFSFVVLGLTPALARRPRSQVRRFCLGTAAALTLVSAAWGAVALSLDDTIGSSLLGDSWTGAVVVLPLTVLEYLALSWNTSSTLGQKILGQARMLKTQRTVMAAIALVLGAAASVALGQTRAVAAALVLAAGASALIGWWSLLRDTRPDLPSGHQG